MLRPPSADVRRSLEAATALYERQVGPALPSLAARGISPASVERFRLGLVGISPDGIADGHEWYAGRLAIPAIGPNGVQSIRFRCMADHDCNDKAVDCDKYRGVGGVRTRLFNLRAVTEAADTIAICEGELDCVILNQCGIPAVAVTGSKNWKSHYPRIFTGFPQVIVVGDNDTAGREFARDVTKSMWNARPVIVGALAEDVSDFYAREGHDALREALGLTV